ncbi:MAG TPA: diaminopropionate ammonia-lyase [Steroidobacteraceae bacterium]|jgi:diaminopropionate ammonia-lyase
MELVLNRMSHRGPYSAAERRVVSLQGAAQALAEMRRWDGYKTSPLRALSALAQACALREIAYKDEAARFSLGSFKALGGGYAAGCELRRRLRGQFGIDAALSDIYNGRHAAELAALTLCCATDGNHGLAVAHAARQFGCRCVVFMHAHAPEHKAAAIRNQGAEVRRTPGTYDDSVRVAREAVRDSSWVLIADTSTADFEQVPAEIIQGYAVMALELLDQFDGRAPTHVFVQGGVGGLAAAIAGSLAEAFGPQRPTLIVVEPETAACLMQSARAGRAARIGGDQRTIMEMLACGEASPVAWTILHQRADAFITIGDDAARDALTQLHSGSAAGFPIEVGPSGAAGLAGLLEVVKQQALRKRLELGPEARVLVFGTEAGAASS